MEDVQGAAQEWHRHSCGDGQGFAYVLAADSANDALNTGSLVRFGLGANKTAKWIEIRWPSGRVQRLTNVAADQILEVDEGAKP